MGAFIRLFVSSTFQDMGAERDLLNRLVFPHLKEFCRRRGIGFAGVDLRWGITEEDAASKKTLKICLDEIDRCHPYFAGILGDRYGWIPPKDFLHTANRAVPENISITEAEMRYGALDRAGVRAIFCIRPTGDGVQEQPDAQAQDALKEEIRRAGYPLLDGYSSPQALAGFFIREFTRIIAEDFPAPAYADEYDAERARHLSHAQNLSAFFTGRDAEVERLSKFVQQNKGALTLDGPAGSGKSTLLARYAELFQAEHPEDFLFLCFREALLEAHDWTFTLRRLLHEIHRRTGTPEPEGMDDVTGLVAALPMALAEASAAFGRVVVIIDGIEALTGDETYRFSWIPASLPGNVRFVFATGDPETSELLQKRKYKTLRIPPFTKAERQRYMQDYLLQFGKRLGSGQTKRILESEHTRSPLFLRVLLSELAVWHNYEGLDGRIAYYLEADSLVALCGKAFARIEEEYGPDTTAETLRLLWLCAYGLREAELLEALGQSQGEWMPLYHALKPFLLESEGVCYLANPQIRQAVEDRYGAPAALRASRRRLIAVFSKPALGARHPFLLPSLLADAGQYARLARRLGSPAAFACLWRRDRYAALRYHTLLCQRAQRYDPGLLLENARQAKRLRAEPCLCMAEFYVQLGDAVRADAALGLILARPDVVGTWRMQALGMRGNLALTAGQYRDAEQLYLQKRTLCLKAGNALECARAEASLGQVAYYTLDMRRAIRRFSAAQRAFRQCGYPQGVQAALGNLGNAYCQVDNYPKARQMFTRQEALCRETANLNGRISALGGLFLVHLHGQRYTEAEAVLDTQHALCIEAENVEKLQVVIGNQAVLAYRQGRLVKTRARLAEKLEMARSIDNFEGMNVALANLADLAHEMGQPEEAIDFAQQRVMLCRRSRRPELLCAALYRLALFLQSAQRVQEAGLAEMEAQLLVSMHGIEHIQDTNEALLVTNTTPQHKEETT